MLLFILLTYENLVTKFENYRELYFDEKFFLICKFNLPYRKGKSQSSRITRAFDDLNDTRYDYNSNHESKYSVTFFQSIQGLIIKSRNISIYLVLFKTNYSSFPRWYFFSFNNKKRNSQSKACSLYRWMDREFQFSKSSKLVDDWFSESLQKLFFAAHALNLWKRVWTRFWNRISRESNAWIY